MCLMEYAMQKVRRLPKFKQWKGIVLISVFLGTLIFCFHFKVKSRGKDALSLKDRLFVVKKLSFSNTILIESENIFLKYKKI